MSHTNAQAPNRVVANQAKHANAASHAHDPSKHPPKLDHQNNLNIDRCFLGHQTRDVCLMHHMQACHRVDTILPTQPIHTAGTEAIAETPSSTHILDLLGSDRSIISTPDPDLDTHWVKVKTRNTHPHHLHQPRPTDPSTNIKTIAPPRLWGTTSTTSLLRPRLRGTQTISPKSTARGMRMEEDAHSRTTKRLSRHLRPRQMSRSLRGRRLSRSTPSRANPSRLSAWVSDQTIRPSKPFHQACQGRPWSWIGCRSVGAGRTVRVRDVWSTVGRATQVWARRRTRCVRIRRIVGRVCSARFSVCLHPP